MADFYRSAGGYIIDLLDHFIQNTAFKAGVSALVVFFLVYLLYKKRKKFKFYSLANEIEMKENSFKAIILPISSPNKTISFSCIKDCSKEMDLSEDDIESFNSSNDDIIDYINKKGIKEIYLNLNIPAATDKANSQSKPIKLLIFKKNDTKEPKKMFDGFIGKIGEYKFNWKIPLLIAIKNYDVLEHVKLIGTDGKNGSYKDLYSLKFILLCLFEKLRRKDGITTDKVESFENFMALTRLVDKLEEDLESKNKYKDKDIAFDITGGQKPVSIVGAFFTLRSRTPILYVSQSNKNPDKIKEINAVINIEPPE